MRMNRLPTTLMMIAALVVPAGCATPPPPVEQKIVVAEPPAPPVGEKPVPSLPPRSTEDRDLFSKGLSLLTRADRPDQEKARAVFASLLERYPQSNWRSASQAFIALIDEIAASREEGRRYRRLVEQLLAERFSIEQSQTERAGARQENEALQTQLRELTEKYQKETAALVQENERLKKDLQRLKALEVELEKRERMLR